MNNTNCSTYKPDMYLWHAIQSKKIIAKQMYEWVEGSANHFVDPSGYLIAMVAWLHTQQMFQGMD